jgi:chromosome segregation ATPase
MVIKLPEVLEDADGVLGGLTASEQELTEVEEELRRRAERRKLLKGELEELGQELQKLNPRRAVILGAGMFVAAAAGQRSRLKERMARKAAALRQVEDEVEKVERRRAELVREVDQGVSEPREGR